MRRVLHPLLILLALVATAIAWPRLPQEMPLHWNVAGEVDRWGSKTAGALLLPLVMLATWVIMRALPKVDPRRANYAKMAGTYDLVITIVLAATLALHVTILAASIGYPVAIGTVAPLVVGVLFIVIGNVLPRARPNWWFGVRTPWTLSNDRVWERTHRVAGYAMFAAGIGIALMAFVPGEAAKMTVLAASGVCAVVPVVYSYFAWRQESSAR
jgi:uncharacterized membrane protein